MCVCHGCISGVGRGPGADRNLMGGGLSIGCTQLMAGVAGGG